jgi:DNA invertase Pin-like site-specific DNA recombinase
MGSSSMIKETMKDKIIRLYCDGYTPAGIARLLNVNNDTVYQVLSRYRKKIKPLNYEVKHKDCAENLVLRMINDIFNTNPIIQNPNRMAAY